MDIRSDAIHWVRARADRNGLRPGEWGVVERDPERSVEEQLADLVESPVAKGCRIELAAAGAALQHRRVDLPGVTAGEAQGVLERRARQLADEAGEELRVSACYRNRANARWLIALPEVQSSDFALRWSDAGIALHRVSSRHLALAHLARNFLDPQDESLTAIFDIGRDRGTCVICDGEGWLFSREISLRFLHLFDSERNDAESSDAETRQPVESLAIVDPSERSFDEESTTGECAGPEASVSAGEGLERDAERIATELRRTFQYVSGELELQETRHVYLSGSAPQLDRLAPAVSRALDVPVSSIDDALTKGSLADTPAAAAAAMGMALAPHPTRGNLLPEALLAAREQQSWRRGLLRSFAGLSFVIAISAGLFLLETSLMRRQAEQLSQSWQATAAEREHVLSMSNARNRAEALGVALAEVDGESPSYLALLELLSRAIPDNAYVERARLEQDDAGWRALFVLEAIDSGLAEAADAVAGLSKRLQSSPLARIHKVEREATPARGAGSGPSSVRFRIEGQLAPVTRQDALGADGA